jgi:hypothetical protein
MRFHIRRNQGDFEPTSFAAEKRILKKKPYLVIPSTKLFLPLLSLHTTKNAALFFPLSLVFSPEKTSSIMNQSMHLCLDPIPSKRSKETKKEKRVGIAVSPKKIRKRSA